MKNIPGKNSYKYAAFLRGVNVGGNTLIKMEDLRKAFQSLGVQGVKTILASGNVLFETPQENTATLSRDIALKLREAFGREIPVIVRSLDDLRELDARQPFRGFEAAPGTRFFVTFLPENAECRDIHRPLAGEGFQILSVSGGIICSILCEKPGVGAAELMGAIEKAYGHNVTTRSWNTITRILKISDS